LSSRAAGETKSLSNVLKYTTQHDEPVLIKTVEIIGPEEDDEYHRLMRSRDSLEEFKQEIAQMHLRAQDEIKKAEIEARKILGEAKHEADTLKLKAQKEGHKLGYQEGFTDGQNVGQAKMQNIIEEAAQKAAQMLALAAAQAQKMIFDANDEIIDIAKTAIQRALCQEVLTNMPSIVAVVKEALDKVRDHEQITVRVNPWNFDLLLEHKHELQKMLGREYDLAITSDKTLIVGGCVIDTSNGSVDARLDTKLELLLKILEEVKNIEQAKFEKADASGQSREKAEFDETDSINQTELSAADEHNELL